VSRFLELRPVIQLTPQMRLLVAVEPVDFRRGIDGLMRLGRMSSVLSSDWQKVYAHPVYFTETFVDPARNRGTCYRAANWLPLGLTTGRGKNDHTNKPNRSLELLFAYPLVRDFRERLSWCAGASRPTPSSPSSICPRPSGSWSVRR
jgi:hypothetical protein